jgi:hypothetical protein
MKQMTVKIRGVHGGLDPHGLRRGLRAREVAREEDAKDQGAQEAFNNAARKWNPAIGECPRPMGIHGRSGISGRELAVWNSAHTIGTRG